MNGASTGIVPAGAGTPFSDGPPPPTGDPAFQPPRDPLRDISGLRERALVIHREIPNVVTQTGWGVQQVRNALQDLVAGKFDTASQLHDAIAGDSRVQSSMRSRSGGLLGRSIRFRIPEQYKNEPEAKKCLRSWERHWPNMEAEPALLDLLETSSSMGFAYSQILWDSSKTVWKPYLQAFSPRFAYYHWTLRSHIAITLDGQYQITGGDGHWVNHAPYGQYRGWMRGSLRALAQWWLARSYALRDWARYCERHGFPILIADTPFGADPNDIAVYQSQLGQLGQESVLQVPGSVDVTKYGKYDLRYLEPADENWQAFKALIEQCNDEITLALLGQNLTSQVKEGSLAAARVHADVRQAILEADARALAKTIYSQVARPFAALNFGDPRLAPRVEWDVRPAEDLEVKGKTFQAFAAALFQLRQAGLSVVEAEKFARKFGLGGLKLQEVPPVQIEAQLARATGKADDGSTSEDESDDDKSKASPAQLKAIHGAFLKASGYNDLRRRLNSIFRAQVAA